MVKNNKNENEVPTYCSVAKGIKKSPGKRSPGGSAGSHLRHKLLPKGKPAPTAAASNPDPTPVTQVKTVPASVVVETGTGEPLDPEYRLNFDPKPIRREDFKLGDLVLAFCYPTTVKSIINVGGNTQVLTQAFDYWFSFSGTHFLSKRECKRDTCGFGHTTGKSLKNMKTAIQRYCQAKHCLYNYNSVMPYMAPYVAFALYVERQQQYGWKHIAKLLLDVVVHMSPDRTKVNLHDTFFFLVKHALYVVRFNFNVGIALAVLQAFLGFFNDEGVMRDEEWNNFNPETYILPVQCYFEMLFFESDLTFEENIRKCFIAECHRREATTNSKELREELKWFSLFLVENFGISSSKLERIIDQGVQRSLIYIPDPRFERQLLWNSLETTVADFNFCYGVIMTVKHGDAPRWANTCMKEDSDVDFLRTVAERYKLYFGSDVPSLDKKGLCSLIVKLRWTPEEVIERLGRENKHLFFGPFKELTPPVDYRGSYRVKGNKTSEKPPKGAWSIQSCCTAEQWRRHFGIWAIDIDWFDSPEEALRYELGNGSPVHVVLSAAYVRLFVIPLGFTGVAAYICGELKEYAHNTHMLWSVELKEYVDEYLYMFLYDAKIILAIQDLKVHLSKDNSLDTYEPGKNINEALQDIEKRYDVVGPELQHNPIYDENLCLRRVERMIPVMKKRDSIEYLKQWDGDKKYLKTCLEQAREIKIDDDAPCAADETDDGAMSPASSSSEGLPNSEGFSNAYLTPDRHSDIQSVTAETEQFLNKAQCIAHREVYGVKK